MSSELQAEQIRVTGQVQGVGFRPTVWRLARECGLSGEVWNDSCGVTIRIWGQRQALDMFCTRLLAETPPLASIDSLERSPLQQQAPANGFRILPSQAGPVHTGIVRGCGDLSGLPCRDHESGRSSLSLSLHQLYPLRAAPEHRAGHPL